MAEKEFTFVNVDTNGKLIVEAPNVKAARVKCDLDPSIWKELEPPPETEVEEPGQD